MSILIKGMELPKDGCHHLICIYADGTVSTGGRVYTAIPVPAPYGRLIDADDAVALLQAHKQESMSKRLLLAADEDAIIRWLDKLPTIIEAEGDGKNEHTD